MNVENKIDPTSGISFLNSLEQPSEPFVMVNLLKFKSRAKYSDEKENTITITGAEAYQRYLDQITEVLTSAGCRFIVNSNISSLFIGKVEELWDRVLLIEYPSRDVFKELITSTVITNAQLHRKAGLKGQLNIATQ